jgi:short-subunit dehydrogenase
MGEVDLVFLCAGTYTRDSATDFDSRLFKRMADVNLIGTAHCLEAVMAKMIGRRRGHIAVVSSVAGYRGLPGGAFYGATKAALTNLCEALYPELESQGVRLSLVSPGFVDTPLTRKNDFPMPFLVSVEEAASTIVDGLKSHRFETVFPWKMALSMKVLRILPHRLLFAITRRLLRKS